MLDANSQDGSPLMPYGIIESKPDTLGLKRAPAPPDATRILVVDDEPAIERLYTQRFRKQISSGEWHFVFARDGVEALQKLRADGDIPVALVDINMPNMDGLTFLAELPKLKVITKAVIVSAYGDMKNIRTAMNRGAFDFLCKPIDFQDVEITIRKTLDFVDQVRTSRRAEEYRLAKEAAEQSYLRLQELEDLRDCLTHMIVHDLRTPMTSYIGGLEVMEMWGGLTLAQRQCLDSSLRGGATLVNMINDLLDISKMEAGVLRLEYKDLLLQRTMESAIDQVASLAEQCGLNISIDSSPDLPTLLADEEKLQRALVNLLGNSIKFTPENGHIVLGAKSSHDGQEIVFQVADNGQGIPPDQQNRIFEKYGQVEGFKKERKMMSSGLGLTFCKLVAEAHGGRIWVESEEGQGSRFMIAIPVKKV